MTPLRIVDDSDILRSADALLRSHGGKAAMECANMADRWAARGDKDAAHVWRRVMWAVRQLQKQRPN